MGITLGEATSAARSGSDIRRSLLRLVEGRADLAGRQPVAGHLLLHVAVVQVFGPHPRQRGVTDQKATLRPVDGVLDAAQPRVGLRPPVVAGLLVGNWCRRGLLGAHEW